MMENLIDTLREDYSNNGILDECFGITTNCCSQYCNDRTIEFFFANL